VFDYQLVFAALFGAGGFVVARFDGLGYVQPRSGVTTRQTDSGQMTPLSAVARICLLLAVLVALSSARLPGVRFSSQKN
jgi:hypothetical protein